MFKRYLLPAAVLLFLTTGCWDRVEIERRGFAIGVAIDLAEQNQSAQRAEKEAPHKPEARPRFMVTHQLVVPAALQGSGGNSGMGGTNRKPFFNVSSVGDTNFEIVRSIAGRTSRTIFAEHMMVILVSENIARTGQFGPLMDVYLRDHEMRRGMKVLIAKGKAKALLDNQPPNERFPAAYIDSVSNNSYKNARMHQPVRIGDVHEYLLEKQSFTLPRIIKGGDKEIKIAGSAVFSGNTNALAGYLGEEETEGLNLLTGKLRGGVLEIPYHDQLIAYEIMDMQRSIKAQVKNPEKITFTIHIKSEGAMGESLVVQDFLNQKTITALEEKVEREIIRMARDTIEKLQNDFQLDALRLGSYLKQNHYDTWEEIKPQWDQGKNVFAQSEIRVTADVNIVNFGVVNQAKNR